MSYLSMGQMGAVIDVYQGRAYRLGALGSGRYAAFIAGNTSTAKAALAAGTLQAVRPGYGIPGCDQAPGACAFDPADPTKLFLTMNCTDCSAPSPWAPTGSGGYAWSGPQPPPWPGIAPPVLPPGVGPSSASPGPLPGPSPVPPAVPTSSVPAPVASTSPAMASAIQRLASQAQSLADSTSRLQDAVARSIQDAQTVDGADTSQAESASSDLDGFVSQAQDLASQVGQEQDATSAQSDLRQLQSVARQAKSAAANAVRQAARAKQVAQAAAATTARAQAAQDAADRRQQMLDAAQANRDAMLAQAQAAAAAPPPPPLPPMPQYAPPSYPAPSYGAPSYGAPQYGAPGVGPDGIPLMYMPGPPQVQVPPAYGYDPAYGQPPPPPPPSPAQPFEIQTFSSDQYFQAPDSFTPGGGELFGLDDYPGEPLWLRGVARRAPGNKMFGLNGASKNGVDRQLSFGKDPAFPSYYPEERWPAAKAGVAQPWEGPFWPANMPPVPAGLKTSGSLGAVAPTSPALASSVAPSIRQQILDDVERKRKADEASSAQSQANRDEIKKWVKRGLVVAGAVVAIGVGSRLLRSRRSPSYVVANGRRRRRYAASFLGL